MGSEQSSSARSDHKTGKTLSKNPRRKVSTREDSTEQNETNDRTASPELSVCSDSDLPYISYTVNRPIGDSPKMSAKQLQRGKSLGSSPARKRTPRKNPGQHNIVVVKPASEPEKDFNLQRLQEIPMFLPIMRGTLNLPGMRDPEVLEKLNPNDLLGVCKKLQNFMSVCADSVGSSQMEIVNQIREVDLEMCKLVTNVGEKQKRLSKQSEKLSKFADLEHQLNKCHIQLNAILELMEDLNNRLPIDARLEPFVWTTG